MLVKMKTFVATFCALALLLIQAKFCSAVGEQTKHDLSCGPKHWDAPILSSPGFPKEYPANAHCEWIISAFDNQIVSLSFRNFKLESDRDCRWDYVMVYDGASKNSSKLLGRFCGKKLPPTLVSSGSKMLIVFHSDSVAQFQGFSAQIKTSYGCDRQFTEDSGEITSPNFPNEYPQPTACTNTIVTYVGYRIQLQFHEFQLENASVNGCEYDYVDVLDGIDGVPPKWRFCGSTKPSVRGSAHHEMSVKFVADRTVSKMGFRITYETIGYNHEDSGEITSPNYPDRYYAYSYRRYGIKVKSGHSVGLVFEEFELEGPSGKGCEYDYVAVYDGPTDSSPKLGTFCGSKKPNVRASTGNMVLIRFVSDGAVSRKGFRIKHYAI